MTEPLNPLVPSAFTPIGHGRRSTAVRRVRVAAGIVVLALVAGTAVALTRHSSSPTGYRTAVAATRTVQQVLDAVATVEPTSQASVAFPVAGTVDDVRVSVDITGPDGAEQYENLRAVVDAHCPVLDLFAAPVPTSSVLA